MARVKRGILRAKHKKIRKLTKGYRTIRRTRIKKGREALLKALSQAYKHRKTKKGEFRRLWIVRLNAAAAEHNLRYSEFIKRLKDKKIELDRKVLAQIAAEHPDLFAQIVEEVSKV